MIIFPFYTYHAQIAQINNQRERYICMCIVYFALLDHICILASSGIITENKFLQIKKVGKYFFVFFMTDSDRYNNRDQIMWYVGSNQISTQGKKWLA